MILKAGQLTGKVLTFLESQIKKSGHGLKLCLDIKSIDWVNIGHWYVLTNDSFFKW